jgi:alkylation response protein AidB-like acyl-CoA dehydrogenase
MDTKPDLLQLGQRILAEQPFSVLLGAELTAFEPGRAELTLPVRREHLQQHGFVHGGAVSYFGGTGWNAVQQHIFEEECADAGAPMQIALRPQDGGAGDHGLRQPGAAGALPAAHHRRHRLVVPGLFRAGLRLRPGLAEDPRRAENGDHYVVNGQKTWNTLGQYADWIFCLVRTSTEAASRRHLLPADRHEDAGHHGAARSS